jgi:hypothetical protein
MLSREKTFVLNFQLVPIPDRKRDWIVTERSLSSDMKMWKLSECNGEHNSSKKETFFRLEPTNHCRAVFLIPLRPTSKWKKIAMSSSTRRVLLAPTACLTVKSFHFSQETNRAREENSNCESTNATLSRHALDEDFKAFPTKQRAPMFHVIIRDTRYRMENCCAASVLFFFLGLFWGKSSIIYMENCCCSRKFQLG